MAIYLIKINKVHITFLTWLICITCVSAQNKHAISGNISDERTSETLAGVNIYANNKMVGVSNEKGFYKFETSEQNVEIIYKYIGFTEHKENVIITSDVTLHIKLKEATGQLEQVIVSAGKYEQEVKRLTVSTEVIKPYLIENKISTNLEKFMDQIPSVNVIDGQVNIRGGSGWTYGAGSRVLVMLDDLPFLSGDAGSVQWKFLPTENLQQIEVIKGAASVLYGSSALNGIINIRTADPKDKPQTSITPFVGYYSKPSNDSLKFTDALQKQYGFNAFHSRKIKQLDLTLAFNYTKDEGYRFGEDDERTRFSFKTKYHDKHFAGLTYGLNGSAMLQNSSSFLLWNGYPIGGLVALNNQATRDKSYNYSLDPHLDFTAFGLIHKLRARYLNVINNIQSPDTTTNQDNSSWLVYGDYQLLKQLPKSLGILTGGICGTYTESNSPLYQGMNSSTNYAPYLQIDLRYKRINFTGGTRFENYKMNTETDHRTIFRTGMNVEVTRSTFIRTSYGEGFRYPSIAERYIKTSVGAVNIFPNPQLKPENGWNAELGIKQGFKIGNWTGFFDAAYFYTEYSDMVEFNFGMWAPFDPNTPPAQLAEALRKCFGFKSFNVGRTRISGYDISLAGQGKIGAIDVKIISGITITDPVSLEPDKIYAYNFSSPPSPISYKSTSADTTGNTLKYRYKDLAKIDVQLGYKNFYIGMSMRYNSYMKNIDNVFLDSTMIRGVQKARDENMNGDFIWDLRAGANIGKHFKIGINVNNLFNHEMMTRPADLRPPRLVMTQITYKF